MRGVLSLLTAATVTLGAGLAQATETSTYTYDALGRVIAVNKASGPNGGSQTTITFDQVHNISARIVGSTITQPPTSSPASFSISGPGTVVEGAVANFIVSLAAASASAVSVSYATSGGSATSGSDFAAASGTLTFQAGQMSQTIPVQTINDAIGEGEETFQVTLSDPSAGASIAQASASANIAANVAANQPPVPGTDYISVLACSIATVNLITNDTDPEGNTPLTLVSVSEPTLGYITTSSTTAIGYRGQTAGSEVLTYVVRDSLGATATGQINVTVRPKTGCNPA